MAAQVADSGRQAIPVLYKDKITWCVPPNLTIYGSQGWYVSYQIDRAEVLSGHWTPWNRAGPDHVH